MPFPPNDLFQEGKYPDLRHSWQHCFVLHYKIVSWADYKTLPNFYLLSWNFSNEVKAAAGGYLYSVSLTIQFSFFREKCSESCIFLTKQQHCISVLSNVGGKTHFNFHARVKHLHFGAGGCCEIFTMLGTPQSEVEKLQAFPGTC